ncbi:hypothetical protein GCM10008090_33570 [Arenicella chitinivorans]|uniref:Uncharacterized protein n=1 Tax=Arenicella chitinivorans TaxID=1329800 RepID=A0A918S2N5_9GAMM|nr:hypothetical protein [Arenicella chitinivorans]GHA20924.1 hypothetical protein GCM10008090_33570 [Arenicella chitinivorans]
MINLFLYIVFLLTSGLPGGVETLLLDEKTTVSIPICEQCDQAIELERDSDDADGDTRNHVLGFVAPNYHLPVGEFAALVQVAFPNTHPIRAPPLT